MLVAVMVMRDEADVIESWVRYHVQLFDHLILADHNSVDRSHEIATALAAEGLPLSVTTVGGASYDQARFLGDLALTAGRMGADWVTFLDADEFLHLRGQDLSQLFSEVKGGRPVRIPWKTYVPTSRDPADEMNVLKRITLRLEEESHQYWKVSVPASLVLEPGNRLGSGSHEWLNGDDVVAASPVTDAAIAHFPVRSRNQLASKILTGWPSSLARSDRTARTSYHWKLWFDRIVEHGWQGLDIAEVAKNYLGGLPDRDGNVSLVSDPLPSDLTDFDLRFTPATATPLAALAATAEHLATELREVRLAETKPGSG